MLKYKIQLKDSNLNIPLDLQFDVAAKEDAIQNFYIEEQIQKSLPPEEDYEITKYIANDVDEIEISLFKFENVPFVLSDFGFTDDDVKFFYNRLQKSFLSITFYDLPNKLQQAQKFQTNLFVQRFRLYDNNVLKSASEIELKFYIKNPKKNTNETEGFYIYLAKNKFIPNFNLFCNFKFNSAFDGVSNLFYLKTGLTVNTVKEEYEYLESNFNQIGYNYNVINKTASYSNNKLIINLYALI